MQLKNKLYSKFHKKCYICGCRLRLTNMTIDHIDARCLGGSNDFNNLALCCKECNQNKSYMESFVRRYPNAKYSNFVKKAFKYFCRIKGLE